MTGSGKTGLGVTLIEEAALDGIPVIAIDPKGDLGNLLLTFPALRAADFRPWIDEADAARQGRTPEEHAQWTADLWRQGLQTWGQEPARIGASVRSNALSSQPSTRQAARQACRSPCFARLPDRRPR